MLILTNCLTDVIDEGCLKVANSLIRRVKSRDDKTYIVSYDREHPLSDKHLELNKFLLSGELRKVLSKINEKVMYVPFPARTLPTALRIFMLSLYCKKKLSVIMVQKERYNILAKILLKLSRAELVVLSNESLEFYGEFVDKKYIKYLKTGVDTKRFAPVDVNRAKELKQKHGFDENVPVILHVGHLKYGRNVQKLLDINMAYQVVLVCSTLTENEQDRELRTELQNRENIRIIDGYIEKIEEIYQLCDVYFFPTVESGNCIDVPLSCMEAASCGKPVISTPFGEMKELLNKQGFYRIENIDSIDVNKIIDEALTQKKNPREAVLYYDWNNAVESLI